MLPQQLILLSLALATSALNTSLTLPDLLGPSLVGTVSFELIDHTRLDPYASPSQSRDLMVSVFYPVQHIRRYKLAPAYTPNYAAYLDAYVGLVPGTAATTMSKAYQGAYLHTDSNKLPPIVFYSSGYGNSRVDYTATLSNLASRGYLVIGVDHPYDANFVDYPDGRNATRSENFLDPEKPETVDVALDVRVKDMQFVLDTLSTNATVARQIPGVHGKLDGGKVGMFGHSFGGAATAGAMLVDPRFACGVNMDGTVFGPVVEAGLSNPFMFIDIGESHNRTTDASWSTLWSKLRGWKAELSFMGSSHLAFSDQKILYEQLKKTGGLPDLGDVYGTIGGEREKVLEDAYLTAFFDKCFGRNDGELLDGESEEFLEVVVWADGSGNDTC